MLVEKMIITTLKLSLDAAKEVASQQDFQRIADKIINRAEGYFPEGSLADIAVEVTTEALRDYFDVEDSDPEN